MSHEKVTGNNSIVEQIQKKVAKIMQSLLTRSRRFSILFGKVIRNFKRSLLCITSKKAQDKNYVTMILRLTAKMALERLCITF